MEFSSEHLTTKVDGASVLCHEAKENEEQAETEVQITAAVMDLTGDSDIEEGAHDEDYSSYELDDSDAVIDADSEDESVKDESLAVHSPQITSVAVDQTVHTFAQSSPVNEQLSSSEKSPTLERTSDHPSSLSSPAESVNNALSPTTSTISSPLKLSSSPEAPALAFSQTSPQKDRSEAKLDTTALSYTFSPPAFIQTPHKEGEFTASAAQANTTPSLEFVFSPPLTRSMARRRSSGLTPAADSYEREDTRRRTPHQSPSNSPISFVSPVPQLSASPRGSRKKVVRLPVHSMTLRARKCPARPTRAAKLPHTKL